MGFDLRDKVVLVTGASGGIGRACAAAFHREGARVIGAARSRERLASLAAELSGDRILTVEMDVTDAAQRASGLARAREAFGEIDVLVNNAGWAAFASVARTSDEHAARMWSLNVHAPLALIREVLPSMLARREGQIINISSVVGTQAIPRMSYYSATKAALNALTTGLRMELRGSGVDVLLVAPSSTRTEFFDAAVLVDTGASRLSKTQYSPERVARAVIRSSRRRRREVTLSVEGRLICLIRRFSHRLADGIMYQVGRRAMPKASE